MVGGGGEGRGGTDSIKKTLQFKTGGDAIRYQNNKNKTFQFDYGRFRKTFYNKKSDIKT